MVHILLEERLVLSSERTPDEVQQSLSELVAPTGTFKWWRPPIGSYKPYEGEVVNYHFHIRRVFQHRNDFRPYIDGIISPSADGSIISVTLQAHPLIRRAVILWVSLLSLVGVAIVIARASLGSLDLQSFFAFALAGIGYLGSLLSYASEASQAKTFLYRLADHGGQ